ncbi:hypothetical protein ACEPAI_698 [Sanghuangporus weigelae]
MDSLIPFTTSGSLVDCVDKKMLVMLRDGRKLVGVLRSYDQFANLVLEDTIERIYHGSEFAEKRVGLFIIRGENVVLLGEIDLDQEDEIPLQQVQYEALKPIYAQSVADKKLNDHNKAQVLFEDKGFCREGGEGDGY